MAYYRRVSKGGLWTHDDSMPGPSMPLTTGRQLLWLQGSLRSLVGTPRVVFKTWSHLFTQHALTSNHTGRPNECPYILRTNADGTGSIIDMSSMVHL